MIITLLTSLLLLADTPTSTSTCTLSENDKARIQWLEAKISNLEQRLGAMAAMYDATVKGFQIESSKPKDPTSTTNTSATNGNNTTVGVPNGVSPASAATITNHN